MSRAVWSWSVSVKRKSSLLELSRNLWELWVFEGLFKDVVRPLRMDNMFLEDFKCNFARNREQLAGIYMASWKIESIRSESGSFSSFEQLVLWFSASPKYKSSQDLSGWNNFQVEERERAFFFQSWFGPSSPVSESSWFEWDESYAFGSSTWVEIEMNFSKLIRQSRATASLGVVCRTITLPELVHYLYLRYSRLQAWFATCQRPDRTIGFCVMKESGSRDKGGCEVNESISRRKVISSFYANLGDKTANVRSKCFIAPFGSVPQSEPCWRLNCWSLRARAFRFPFTPH